jgi:NTP pyrophosphatase (non-canonical NTP hydrolase)
MSDLNDLKRRALQIREQYAELSRSEGQATWSGKEYAMGFVGDVGDLIKLVMAKENLRYTDDVDAKLAHELSDCLWSLLVIADAYDVDLEAEFLKSMDKLQMRIKEEKR